jgi:hypothetical protein
VIKLSNYVRFDHDNTDFQVKIGEKESRIGIHDVKKFATFCKPEHNEKYLVFGSVVTIDVAPSMKGYDMLMRKYLAEEFNVYPTDLQDKWSKRCWNNNCSLTTNDLKSCSVCKVGKYCSQDCQKDDFDVHKMMHKTIREIRCIPSQLPTFQDYCKEIAVVQITRQ